MEFQMRVMKPYQEQSFQTQRSRWISNSHTFNISTYAGHFKGIQVVEKFIIFLQGIAC